MKEDARLGVHLGGAPALVTGSSRGIGARIAVALARAGASVAVHCHSSRSAAGRVAREIREATGRTAPVIAADLAREDGRRDLYRKFSRRLGPPALLVHNAAIFERNPFEEADDSAFLARWRRTMTVNLEAAAHLTLLALPAMRTAGFGRIVMISSRAAFRGETDCADYAVSKAGMVNLARCLARNEGRHGITANSVCPGWVETDMARADLAARGDSIRGEIPLGRVATPDDVAAAVLYLVSPGGSYVNGAAIPLNGGSYLH